jgi:hypothetical protein
MDSAKTESISEEWLASVGFKWHQLERQPAKHWVLWLGGRRFLQSYEDLGVELAPSVRDGNWTCWLRSDFAGRYHRFIFLRHLTERRELISLIESLCGLPWVPENNLYGAMRTPEEAAWIRSEDDRLDRILLQSNRSPAYGTRRRLLRRHTGADPLARPHHGSPLVTTGGC